MTFAELQTELYARGTSYLNEDDAGRTRAKRFINAGRAELDRAFLWPWREATASGAAPLTITDLGVIESVTNSSGGSLGKADRQSLDLTATGTATSYYADWSTGSRVVNVNPASGETITVRYWKTTPDLVDDADEPLSPDDAHYLIVDLAMRRAYRDDDAHDLATAVQQEIDSQLDALLFNYPPGQADGPDSYVGNTLSASDW